MHNLNPFPEKIITNLQLLEVPPYDTRKPYIFRILTATEALVANKLIISRFSSSPQKIKELLNILTELSDYFLEYSTANLKTKDPKILAVQIRQTHMITVFFVNRICGLLSTIEPNAEIPVETLTHILAKGAIHCVNLAQMIDIYQKQPIELPTPGSLTLLTQAEQNLYTNASFAGATYMEEALTQIIEKNHLPHKNPEIEKDTFSICCDFIALFNINMQLVLKKELPPQEITCCFTEQLCRALEGIYYADETLRSTNSAILHTTSKVFETTCTLLSTAPKLVAAYFLRYVNFYRLAGRNIAEYQTLIKNTPAREELSTLFLLAPPQYLDDLLVVENCLTNQPETIGNRTVTSSLEQLLYYSVENCRCGSLILPALRRLPIPTTWETLIRKTEMQVYAVQQNTVPFLLQNGKRPALVNSFPCEIVAILKTLQLELLYDTSSLTEKLKIELEDEKLLQVAQEYSQTHNKLHELIAMVSKLTEYFNNYNIQVYKKISPDTFHREVTMLSAIDISIFAKLHKLFVHIIKEYPAIKAKSDINSITLEWITNIYFFEMRWITELFNLLLNHKKYNFADKIFIRSITEIITALLEASSVRANFTSLDNYQEFDQCLQKIGIEFCKITRAYFELCKMKIPEVNIQNLQGDKFFYIATNFITFLTKRFSQNIATLKLEDITEYSEFLFITSQQRNIKFSGRIFSKELSSRKIAINSALYFAFGIYIITADKSRNTKLTQDILNEWLNCLPDTLTTINELTSAEFSKLFCDVSDVIAKNTEYCRMLFTAIDSIKKIPLPPICIAKMSELKKNLILIAEKNARELSSQSSNKTYTCAPVETRLNAAKKNRSKKRSSHTTQQSVAKPAATSENKTKKHPKQFNKASKVSSKQNPASSTDSAPAQKPSVDTELNIQRQTALEIQQNKITQPCKFCTFFGRKLPASFYATTPITLRPHILFFLNDIEFMEELRKIFKDNHEKFETLFATYSVTMQFIIKEVLRLGEISHIDIPSKISIPLDENGKEIILSDFRDEKKAALRSFRFNETPPHL